VNEWLYYIQTGEIYYINWRNGMKAKEDPRRAAYEQEPEEEEEEESWYDDDSEEEEEEEESSSECSISKDEQQLYEEKQNVLVVAGCKSCLMYFMVPKQGEDCPKCNGQLLHFDRSENCSP
jgi:RecA-family ATPase